MALVLGSAAAQQSRSLEEASPNGAAINTEKEPQSEKPAAETAAFKNRKEKLSYAFGLALAGDMRRQNLNLDVDMVTRALRDAVEGKKLLMTGTEALTALKTFQAERQQDLEHANRMLSEKNKRAAEATFAENIKKEDIVTLPSGLQYKILKQADGKKPSVDDKIICHYRGTLLDGNEFDNSYKRNQPATLPVKGMIKGWTEALQLMPVGSKWQFFIPPQLGYGEKVVGGIGPNSTLVFEIELLSIQDEVQKLQDKPQAAASKPQGSL
jgi:FKBP-type peptidyl-prolyl cis-trans isomerase